MALSATGCNQRLRLTILDLPTDIVVDILLQLSDKSIVFCKCTCKFLHGIVADRQFARLYIAKPARSSDVYLMIRPVRDSLVSKTLYLVHPRLCMIEQSGKMKLETTLKILLDNFEMVLDSVKLSQSQRGKKSKHCLGLNPVNHRFDIVNSCHGFLCLSGKDALVVCNPMTGEFVSLTVTPRPMYMGVYDHVVSYAFGFSPSAKCYKVIRQFGISAKEWPINYPIPKYLHIYSSYTQIQILGSGSWKTIDNGPYFRDLNYITYLSGTLNWIYLSSQLFIVATFDLVHDQFGSIPLPTDVNSFNRVGLGVLKDCLCLCDASRCHGDLVLWVMKEYGVEGSWTMIYKVALPRELYPGPFGSYTPITRLDNGAIIMFLNRSRKRCGPVYYHPKSNIMRFSCLKDLTEGYEAISFAPSFIRLNDVLVDDEAEVLNVKSRCAELMVQRGNDTSY